MAFDAYHRIKEPTPGSGERLPSGRTNRGRPGGPVFLRFLDESTRSRAVRMVPFARFTLRPAQEALCSRTRIPGGRTGAGHRGDREASALSGPTARDLAALL